MHASLSERRYHTCIVALAPRSGDHYIHTYINKYMRMGHFVRGESMTILKSAIVWMYLPSFLYTSYVLMYIHRRGASPTNFHPSSQYAKSGNNAENTRVSVHRGIKHIRLDLAGVADYNNSTSAPTSGRGQFMEYSLPLASEYHVPNLMHILCQPQESPISTESLNYTEPPRLGFADSIWTRVHQSVLLDALDGNMHNFTTTTYPGICTSGLLAQRRPLTKTFSLASQ